MWWRGRWFDHRTVCEKPHTAWFMAHSSNAEQSARRGRVREPEPSWGWHGKGGTVTITNAPLADSETVDAVGKATEALEYVERARGHLYAFHQLIGRADAL